MTDEGLETNAAWDWRDNLDIIDAEFPLGWFPCAVSWHLLPEFQESCGSISC